MEKNVHATIEYCVFFVEKVLLSSCYIFHLIILLLLLNASNPGVFYPVLSYVHDAIRKNLSRIFHHCYDLNSILNDNSGIKLIRDLRRGRAVWDVSLTFAQDHFAEQQASPIHEAHSRKLGEIDAMTK